MAASEFGLDVFDTGDLLNFFKYHQVHSQLHRQDLPCASSALDGRSHALLLPCNSHHSHISHPAREQGIGLFDILDRMTMQLFVQDYDTMILTAPTARLFDFFRLLPFDAMMTNHLGSG
jgi:hypothetical protein